MGHVTRIAPRAVVTGPRLAVRAVIVDAGRLLLVNAYPGRGERPLVRAGRRRRARRQPAENLGARLRRRPGSLAPGGSWPSRSSTTPTPASTRSSCSTRRACSTRPRPRRSATPRRGEPPALGRCGRARGCASSRTACRASPSAPRGRSSTIRSRRWCAEAASSRRAGAPRANRMHASCMSCAWTKVNRFRHLQANPSLALVAILRS